MAHNNGQVGRPVSGFAESSPGWGSMTGAEIAGFVGLYRFAQQLLDFHHGDTDQVAAAFARAAHVTRMKILNSRVVVCPMEPRAAIGEHDAASARCRRTGRVRRDRRDRRVRH